MVRKTKICPHCGREIPLHEEICRYCFTNLKESEFMSKNYGMFDYTIINEPLEEIPLNINEMQIDDSSNTIYTNYNEKYSNVLPIRRLFLLMIFTLGIYQIYWFYKNTKYTKEYGKNVNVAFRTICFIIPIINWFAFYYLLKDMKNLIKSRNLECYSPICNTLLYIFIPILGFWSIINVQESMNEFWRVEQWGLREKRNFRTGEKVILILVILLIGFVYLIFILAMITLLFPNLI